MSNDNRNMILAIVLSALVLFGWSVVTNYYFPAANPPATKIEQGKQVPVPQPQASPAPTSPAATRDRDLVLRETAGERIRIETPALRGSLYLRGARIDDLVLLRHREGIAANSPPIRLFSPVGTPGAYYASFGWSGPQATDALRPKADTLWTASGGPALTPATPVTLSWDNGHGPDLPDRAQRSTTVICSPPSRSSSMRGQPGRARRQRPRQPGRREPRSLDAGRAMSVRSACSTAPPITTTTISTVARSAESHDRL